jgi:uncharacterized protein (UPF0548 family)
MQFLVPILGHRPDLARWEALPISAAVALGPRPSDYRDCFEGVVATEPPGEPLSDGPFRRVAAAIRDYRVFPPSLVEGVLRNTPIQTGDTVGILFHIIPGIDLFSAARVTATFDDFGDGIWRAGFTYRTLDGHPELGEETFAVEKQLATGEVTASLRSWSRPGTWLTRAGWPITRWFQVHANRAAVRHLLRIASGGEPDCRSGRLNL